MEEHLGKETVREHRASIELSGELPSDSADTKQQKRTVGDFRVGLSNEVADAGELLRNYEFNISQGIVQRVSRFFDALALMDEHGEAPSARGEGGGGGKEADSARGGVMGFGRKRNVCNLEKKPARRVAWEQQEKERIQMEAAAAKEAAAAAACKAAEQDAKVAALESQVAAAAARKAQEQDAKVAALEAKVAEMQALAAPLRLCARAWLTPPSAPIPPPHIPAPSAFTHRTFAPPHVENMCFTTCRSSAGASCAEMVRLM